MSLPCSIAFAFVLVLIRSKPAGITIEEYILTLREASSHSHCRPNLVEIDDGKVWERLFCLGQQTPRSRASLLYVEAGSTGVVAKGQSQDGKKRKPQDDTANPSQQIQHSKRLRLTLPSAAAVECHATHETAIYQAQMQVLQVNRQLAHMAQTSSLDGLDVPRTVSAACDAILQMVKDSRNVVLHGGKSKSQIPGFSEAFSEAKHIWSLVVSILDRLHEDFPTSLDLDLIISSMSSVIQTFLDYLRHHCLDEAEIGQIEALKLAGQNVSSSTRSKNDLELNGLSKHYCNAVTGNLKCIISTFQRLKRIYQKLWDTIAGDILRHIGEVILLHLLAPFNQCSASKNIIVPLAIKGSLNHDVETALSAARIEAPYLVELLSCLVQSSELEEASRSRNKELETLQRSLLQGIFDDEVAGSETWLNEFVKRSVVENDDSELIKNGGEDCFLTQIWDLLGWDILLS